MMKFSLLHIDTGGAKWIALDCIQCSDGRILLFIPVSAHAGMSVFETHADELKS